MLEYYSGILILTTNRVGSFDEAIKSRVHLALYYPPLDSEQSLKIWKMNLDTLDECNKSPDYTLKMRFDRKKIEDYAESHWKNTPESGRWNGRQIKNAFQAATALAEWDHFQHTGGNPNPDGPLLTQKHFKTVAKASAHFDDYLAKVRGTDQERARGSEARDDNIRSEARRSERRRTRKASSHRGRTNKGHSRRKKKDRSPSPESEESTGSEEGSESEEGSSGESEEEERHLTPPPREKKSKRKSRRD